MRKRFENKRAILALAVFALSCGGNDSTPTSACIDAAGFWTVGFTNSCGAHGNATTVISQTGCAFSASIAGQGSVTGTIDGISATFTLRFSEPCSGSASGSGTFSAAADSFSGTYSGHTAGGAGCCEPVSGTFTFLR